MAAVVARHASMEYGEFPQTRGKARRYIRTPCSPGLLLTNRGKRYGASAPLSVDRIKRSIKNPLFGLLFRRSEQAELGWLIRHQPLQEDPRSVILKAWTK